MIKELEGIYKRALEAEAVLQNPALLDGHPQAAVFQMIRAAAREAKRAATAEVRIGVAGVMNVGKSLLINTLLGKADLLPIKDGPQTGNVTVLRLVPNDGLRTTEIDECTIEFFDAVDARACLSWFIEKAREKGGAAGLDAGLLRKLPPTPVQPETASAWKDTYAWAEQAWSNPSIALRNLIRELVRFLRSYQSLGPLLCNGEPLKIPFQRATQLLGLPASNDNISTMKFADLPPVPNAPAARPAAEAFTQQLLRDSYPLIRHVNVRVQLSNAVWGLSGLKGSNDVILCDTPGLGAAETVVRDSFLIDRELDPKKVQTVIVLLNGNVQQDTWPNQLFDVIKRGRSPEELKDVAIVGIGRFDQLLTSENSVSGLVALEAEIKGTEGGPFPAAIGDDAVLDQLTNWRALRKDAKSFVPANKADDRILPLCPSLAAVTLSEDFQLISNNIDTGNPESIASRRREVQTFLDMKERWQALADRLRKDDSNSQVARSLNSLLEDGGIDRLRKEIKDHVEKHGLKQVLASAKRTEKDLDRALRQLPKTEVIDSAGPETKELAQHISALHSLYQEFKTRLERGNLDFLVKDPSGKDVPLREKLTDDAYFEVNNWPELSRLFNRMNRCRIGGEVVEDAPLIVVEKPKKLANLVTKTDDFVLPYERTIQWLRDDARQLLETAFMRVITEFESSDEFDHLREEIGRYTKNRSQVSEFLKASMTEFDEESDRLLRNLVHALAPTRWGEHLLKQVTFTEKSEDGGADPPEFPLPRQDGRHDQPTYLPWANERQLKGAHFGNLNHMTVVASLLVELGKSAARVITSDVDRWSMGLVRGLVTNIQMIIDDLEIITKHPQLPRLIVEASRGASTADPKEVAIARLRELVPSGNQGQAEVNGGN